MIPATRSLLSLLLSAAMLSACAAQTPSDPATSDEKQQFAEQIGQMEPQFLYLAAQNAIKDGNTELAAEFLSALVARDPEAIEPHVQLAGLLLQLGRSDEAEAQIATLLKKPLTKEDHEKLLLTQAQLKVAGQQLDEALTLLNRLLKENPVHIQGRDLQARILSDQDRVAEALAEIEKAILIEEMPEFRLLQAQLYLKQKDFKSAEIALKRLGKVAPDNDTAVLILSNIAQQEKNPGKAEKLLREFLESHPDAVLVGHALGKLMIQEKRIAEAILIYRELATRTGDNPEILRTLGMLYFQYQEFEKSEQTFRKLHQNSPDDQNSFYLAASLEALERPDEAQELYESIDPDGPMGDDAQVRLAGIDFADDRISKAVARLNRLLKSDPENTEAQILRSVIRLAEKQYATLLDETAPLLEASKIHPQILFNRAVAFEHMKRYIELENTLNQLLANHPKHAEALNFLGYSYAVQGVQLDKAESLVREALKLKPDNGYYLDSLAWVYYKRGEFAKALEAQKRAVELVNDDPVMYEHLGDILWRSGDSEAARQAWQKALDTKSETPAIIRKKIAGGLQEDE